MDTEMKYSAMLHDSLKVDEKDGRLAPFSPSVTCTQIGGTSSELFCRHHCRRSACQGCPAPLSLRRRKLLPSSEAASHSSVQKLRVFSDTAGVAWGVADPRTAAW